VRPAWPDDSAAIREVHIAAFGGPVEAKLVSLITEREKAVISFVAVTDSRVVAHILFSLVTVANAPPVFKALGLGPVAVLPVYQKQGIGFKLIQAGLEKCRQARYDAVVVLGDPAYYSRFGFQRAADFGLDNEYGALEEFMVLTLHDRALMGVSGMVKYAPEFNEVGC